MKNSSKILCPTCGTEYYPSEIFVPSAFIGSINPIRDKFGKVVDLDGTAPNFKETYNCDVCHTDFSIKASVQYTTSISPDNFDEEYRSEIYKPIELCEE